jgi:hypothetical protein
MRAYSEYLSDKTTLSNGNGEVILYSTPLLSMVIVFGSPVRITMLHFAWHVDIHRFDPSTCILARLRMAPPDSKRLRKYMGSGIAWPDRTHWQHFDVHIVTPHGVIDVVIKRIDECFQAHNAAVRCLRRTPQGPRYDLWPVSEETAAPCIDYVVSHHIELLAAMVAPCPRIGELLGPVDRLLMASSVASVCTTDKK